MQQAKQWAAGKKEHKDQTSEHLFYLVRRKQMPGCYENRSSLSSRYYIHENTVLKLCILSNETKREICNVDASKSINCLTSFERSRSVSFFSWTLNDWAKKGRHLVIVNQLINAACFMVLQNCGVSVIDAGRS